MPQPVTSDTEVARLQRVRRKARRTNERIWKVHPNTPDAWRYAPFGVITIDNNALVASGLTLADLEERYT